MTGNTRYVGGPFKKEGGGGGGGGRERCWKCDIDSQK